MKKIWYRVGMETEITDEQYEELLKADGQNGGEFDSRKKNAIMKDIISHGTLSGETYILSRDNCGVEEYDNPNVEINFLF